VQATRLVSVVGVLAALGAAFWWMAPAGAPDKAVAPPIPPPAAKPAGTTPVVFGIVPTIDDRFGPEPCNRVLAGGLMSLAAFMGEIREQNPASIGLSLGDLTVAPGGMGRHAARHHYTTVFPHTGVENVAAGEGELALGTLFIREMLTRIDGVKFICANAADPEGRPLMNGYVLLRSGDRGVLLVAVACESLQDGIRRSGSDVRILPAADAVRKARAEGLEQASRLGETVDVSVLAVHGTVDEAAALVAANPGFTIATAAHGAVLPDAEPRVEGGVPIFYAGRGLRFGWRVLVPPDGGAPVTSLARIGRQAFGRTAPYAEAIAEFREMSAKKFFPDVVATPGDRPTDTRGRYVGGARCGDCHQAEAAQHAASRHAKLTPQIVDSNFGASTGCISCHTTAPYWDSGWPGPPDHSDLASVSCEACHGPGEQHAATRSKGYGRVGLARCVECHLPDRSPGFDADAIWKRAGHRLK
jgi:hypothetical protein